MTRSGVHSVSAASDGATAWLASASRAVDRVTDEPGRGQGGTGGGRGGPVGRLPGPASRMRRVWPGAWPLTRRRARGLRVARNSAIVRGRSRVPAPGVGRYLGVAARDVGFRYRRAWQARPRRRPAAGSGSTWPIRARSPSAPYPGRTWRRRRGRRAREADGGHGRRGAGGPLAPRTVRLVRCPSRSDSDRSTKPGRARRRSSRRWGAASTARSTASTSSFGPGEPARLLASRADPSEAGASHSTRSSPSPAVSARSRWPGVR